MSKYNHVSSVVTTVSCTSFSIDADVYGQPGNVRCVVYVNVLPRFKHTTKIGHWVNQTSVRERYNYYVLFEHLTQVNMATNFPAIFPGFVLFGLCRAKTPRRRTKHSQVIPLCGPVVHNVC